MVIPQKPKPYITGSTAALVRIAGFGGLLVCAAGYTFKVLIERRFRNAEFYQKAVDHVMAHKALLDFLGEPVKFGNVNIGDSGTNYATTTEAACEIPIFGSKNRGKMSFKAIRKEVQDEPAAGENQSKASPDCEYCTPVKLSSWQIQRIEIAVDNRPNERIVVPLDLINRN